MDTTEPRLDPRRREAHLERITVGNEVFIRNDIRAKELGESERSLNRSDKLGAPYRFFGGVKYRPQRLHAEFIMRTIEMRKPQTQKKTRKRTAESRALAGRRSSAPPRRRRARPRVKADGLAALQEQS
jgi:hypothetical protein